MILKDRKDTYIVVFRWTSIAFGLVLGLLFGIQMGIMQGVLSGVLGGLFYGFCMAIICGGMHNLFVKILNSFTHESIMGVHQVDIFTVENSYDVVYRQLLDCVANVKGWSISHHDKEAGAIRIKTGMTWKSFGENILITVSSDVKEECKVSVSSKPIIKTTLVDYGKGIENVRLLIEEIKKSSNVRLLNAPIENSDSTPAKLLDDKASTSKDDGMKIDIRDKEYEKEQLPDV